MRKALKWTVIIAGVLCITSMLLVFKVYQDMKDTAEKLYVPVENVQSSKRETTVDMKSEIPFSALILGVDEREGDVGRSDTLIVLTVNPTTQTTKMISIPRDTYTEIVGTNKMDKINHAYAFGGIGMSMQTVEKFLDIPIDYVGVVNMESFQEIIDILGGITVNNELEFDYDGQHFAKGEINLDGETALKFVRMRYEDPMGDFGRQNRQKQVVQGVIQEAVSFNTALNYKNILRILESNVQMNAKFEDLIDIQKNYASSFKNIEQLYFTTGTSEIINSIYYYVPDEMELEKIQIILKEHLDLTM